MRILYIFWFRPEIATAIADVRRESIGMPMSEVLRDYVKTLIGDLRGVEPHQSPAIHPDAAEYGQRGDSAKSG